LTDFASFPVTSFFDIFVDLSVDGGLAGSATFGSAAVQLTATPEPAAVLLTLAGFVMFAVSGRRLKKPTN
jgi:hypothetical protein